MYAQCGLKHRGERSDKDIVSDGHGFRASEFCRAGTTFVVGFSGSSSPPTVSRGIWEGPKEEPLLSLVRCAGCGLQLAACSYTVRKVIALANLQLRELYRSMPTGHV